MVNDQEIREQLKLLKSSAEGMRDLLEAQYPLEWDKAYLRNLFNSAKTPEIFDGKFDALSKALWELPEEYRFVIFDFFRLSGPASDVSIANERLFRQKEKLLALPDCLLILDSSIAGIDAVLNEKTEADRNFRYFYVAMKQLQSASLEILMKNYIPDDEREALLAEIFKERREEIVNRFDALDKRYVEIMDRTLGKYEFEPKYTEEDRKEMEELEEILNPTEEARQEMQEFKKVRSEWLDYFKKKGVVRIVDTVKSAVGFAELQENLCMLGIASDIYQESEVQLLLSSENVAAIAEEPGGPMPR